MKGKALAVTVGKILLSLLFWGLIWVIVSHRVGNDFLFPSPADVSLELWHLLFEKSFWLTTLTSLLRVLWGIAISWILGTLLAYLTCTFRLLDVLLSPAIAAVKSTPVASFIILALLWMERQTLPVFITALIVIPIVWANVSEGIRSVDPNLREVASIYRFSIRKRVFRLYLPSIAPYFLAACQSALGMAWKASVAAEILAVPQYSIGTEIYHTKYYFEIPELFAWTATVVTLSLLMEWGLTITLNHLQRRRPS